MRARFDAPEAVLLRSLIELVVDLLTNADADPVQRARAPGRPAYRPDWPGRP